ncbi:rho-related protein racB-like [Atheta coriaria]|uniref:rho-related protein racB-like n=1 Tax=Dalotia coriaria TaxID=877792 RepID=UPI0031F39E93
MSRRPSTGNKWPHRFSKRKSSRTGDVNMQPNGHEKTEEEQTIRITVVGDGHTGKTCLLIGYKDKVYNDVYIPTVFDSYSMNIPINNKNYRLILQDTAGQEDYDNLRPLGYPQTDVFIICYAIDRKDSYQNVEFKWAKEVRHYLKKCKIILVGTKCDMRDSIANSLNFQDGLNMAEKIRADDFIECSAKEMYNVDQVFSMAMMACVQKPAMRKQSKCVLF